MLHRSVDAYPNIELVSEQAFNQYYVLNKKRE
jgi:hypothetical protein